MEWWLSAPFLKRRYWKYFNVLFFFFFGICPLSFFVHDCMSSFALSASCLTLQIEFHYRLSDCSFAFQITATAQTLLVSSSRGIHSRLRPESSNPCGVVLACPEHQGASPAPVVRMKCPLVHRRDAHLSGSEPLEIWSSLAFFYYYFFLCVWVSFL